MVSALPGHPLLLTEEPTRARIAEAARSLREQDLRRLGNWRDIEQLGRHALDGIDVDAEEIFRPLPNHFECLATPYVVLQWQEGSTIRESLVATIRGMAGWDVAIESVNIGTSSLTGGAEGLRE